MSKVVVHKASTRGHADHGWLNAYHSFSFANWYDQERMHFGALRVLNDDTVKPSFGFGKHPHDNMEIITVVLNGTLEHKDSMGHTQAIHAGEVQVMSAGSGVFHSENNHSKTEAVNLMQIWIFPKERNVTPRYDQKMYDAGERINKWQLLVSPMGSDDEGLKIYQDAWIYRTNLDKGKEIDHVLHNDKNGLYIMIIDGQVKLDNTILDKRDAIGISGKANIRLSAMENSDILLLEVPMYA